jgi:tRNA threonylcarbamoyladenosine biosynthesis protein TsaB
MIIGIDTSTPSLGIAILVQGRIAGSIAVHRPNCHDELLVPLAQELLRACGLSASDLRAVAVSAGPGSFTGLRIGMAAAKGLALALGIPLIAVPSFDAVARGIAGGMLPESPFTLCIAADARRGDVYAAAYDISSGAAQPRMPLRALPADALPDHLPPGTWLAGDAAENIAARRADLRIVPSGAGGAHAVSHAGAHAGAHAVEVALLGAELLEAGAVADTDDCEPIYLRDVYTAK